MAHSIEKRIVRLEDSKVEAPAGVALGARALPAAAASRAGSCSRARAWPSATATSRCSATSTSRSSAASGSSSWASTAPARRASCACSPASGRPTEGSYRLGHNVVAGYYAQEHEGIHAGRTILEHLREQVPQAADPDLRAIVGAMGLTGDKVHQDAGTLSGGEKTKLALGILVAGRHNLLLLDEPTNNLDPGSREAVAEGLRGWPGQHRAGQPRRRLRPRPRARPGAAHARGHRSTTGPTTTSSSSSWPSGRGGRDSARAGARALHVTADQVSRRRPGSSSWCRAPTARGCGCSCPARPPRRTGWPGPGTTGCRRTPAGRPGPGCSSAGRSRGA